MKKNKTYEKKYINKFKHILLNNKKENGSIALYVIVSLVFLSIVLISMLATSKNSFITALKSRGTIKNIYENSVVNVDDVYDGKLEEIRTCCKTRMGNSR